MLKTNKELFLSFLGIIMFRLHIWHLKRNSKRLLEKKQDNHTEYTQDKIFIIKNIRFFSILTTLFYNTKIYFIVFIY